MTGKNLFTTWALSRNLGETTYSKHVKSSFLWLSRFSDTKCRARKTLGIPTIGQSKQPERKKSLQTPLSGLQGNTKYKHLQTRTYKHSI